MSDLLKRADRCAIGLEAQAKGFGPHSNHAQTSAAKAKTVRLLIAAIENLADALTEMVEEKADYMRVNNLGDPEEQHTIKAARSALRVLTDVEEVAN